MKHERGLVLFFNLIPMNQNREIQQIDTLHGLLVKVNGSFCFHGEAGHELDLTHNQLFPRST